VRQPARLVRRLAIAAAVAAVLAGAFLLARPHLERAVRSRIEGTASRHGLVARLEGVRVGIWPPLALTGVRLEKPGVWSAETAAADVTLRLWGSGLLGRTRVRLDRVTLTGPGGLILEAAPTRWDLATAAPDGLRAELMRPSAGLTATWIPGTEDRLEVAATDLPADLFRLRRDGAPLLEAGRVTGTFRLARSPASTRFELDAGGRDVRVSALGSDNPAGDDAPALGPPTDVTFRLAGSWRPGGTLEVPRWELAVDGAAISGSLALAGLPGDPRVDLSLAVERLDFARLLRTSGADAVEAVSLRGDADAMDLGSASLTARFQGRLADPASFTVSQRLDFTPPRRLPAAVTRLRGDFVHEVTLPRGKRRAIEVSPASPDFIRLDDVPPLFVRTLLLGEDAGFFGHRGIDLGELPSALLTNWARGAAARGASTITQQLAKNLFLSREKRLGRKLRELSLALLLEAGLGKERILEIYLNVIEWGPGVHGLRTAARRYFHEEPADLTPAQIAFLVALIPGPVRYQASFANGTVSPGFRTLVDDLLAKLHSAGALSDAQYEAAVAEELTVDAAPGE
jgi:hypothetical protein